GRCVSQPTKGTKVVGILITQSHKALYQITIFTDKIPSATTDQHIHPRPSVMTTIKILIGNFIIFLTAIHMSGETCRSGMINLTGSDHRRCIPVLFSALLYGSYLHPIVVNADSTIVAFYSS